VLIVPDRKLQYNKVFLYYTIQQSIERSNVCQSSCVGCILHQPARSKLPLSRYFGPFVWITLWEDGAEARRWKTGDIVLIVPNLLIELHWTRLCLNCDLLKYFGCAYSNFWGILVVPRILRKNSFRFGSACFNTVITARFLLNLVLNQNSVFQSNTQPYYV